ncbi:TM2 domain-containing protein [bacterium]|nr:TM2 domain-containing protein [bacterium]
MTGIENTNKTKKKIDIKTLLYLFFPNDSTKNIKRNKYLAGFLAIFGGIIGLHQFYLRKPFTGLLYILFFWISPIIGFIDAFVYITMPDEKWDKKYNKQFTKTNN